MLVIIGAGLAAYNVAKAYRKINTETAITMITADTGDFYSKPQLSTGLSKQKTAADFIVTPVAQMALQLDATIITDARVSAIDVVNQVIAHSQGTTAYKQLVIATGAALYHAPVAGDVADIIAVNHLSDYARLQQQLSTPKHVTIMGSGLVGCEFANDLLAAGHQVTVVSPDLWPLQRFLPQPLGEAMQHQLATEGVDWRLGLTVSDMQSQQGRYQLTLCDQQQLTTDLVLSAIGFRPDEQVARMAGANCDQGVLVNAQLQTSVKNIYAIGDCAVVNQRWRPYVAPILHGAKVLATVLNGGIASIDYPPMPIVTKTPLCPCVLMPPPATMHAIEWRISGSGHDLEALCYQDQQLVGFALLGSCIRQRQTLLAQLS